MSKYSPAEIERGLLALASENGMAARASRQLKRDGLKIPARTLADWRKKTHVERYEAVRDEVLPRIQRESAAWHRDLERKQLELSAKLTERLRGEADTMETRDAVNAMGKSDIGSGIHAEKAQLLDGEPTHRPARDAIEVLRDLAEIGFQPHNQPTAEVIDVKPIEETHERV